MNASAAGASSSATAATHNVAMRIAPFVRAGVAGICVAGVVASAITYRSQHRLEEAFGSVIAGKPIALLLAEQMATVTLCHIATKDLASHTRRADILVVAVGKAGLIRGEQVKEGAVVIDVGINRVAQPDGAEYARLEPGTGVDL